MNKETFHKKWYYRLIQVLFWGTLIPILVTLAVISASEDDIPAAGFFWAGVIVFIYWIAKRILYRIMFGENIFPKKK